MFKKGGLLKKGIIFFILLCFTSTLGNAQTTISFDPPLITSQVGDTFEVNITMDNVSNLLGVELTVSFDPDILQLLEIQEGNLLRKGGHVPVELKKEKNNSEGKASYDLGILASTGITGSGVYATFKFKVNESARIGSISYLNFLKLILTKPYGIPHPYSPPINGTILVVGRLSTILVNPANPELEIGDILKFSAIGMDGYGNIINITPNWNVTGGIGNINGTGFFKATNLGSGKVIATYGNLSGRTSVTVTPPKLRKIEVFPDQVEVVIGQNKTFIATCYDKHNNNISIEVDEWNVAGDIGT
ncbi:MAG: cohesin domain-containing protein, partial [Methanosarcinales archaeon]